MSERKLVSLIRKIPSVEQFEKLAPKFLADSLGLQDNVDLKVLCNELLNELMFLNPSQIEKDNLKALDIQSVEVFNVWVRGVSFSGACITLDFACDCTRNGDSYELIEEVVESGDLVSGVSVENLVRVAFCITIDCINNKYVLGLDEIDLCTHAPRSVEGSENSFIPYGRISQYSYLPFSLELLKSYGKIPKGTELFLNADRLVYEDTDKTYNEVIPVEIVETILNTSLSSEFGDNKFFKIKTAMIRHAVSGEEVDDFPSAEALGEFLSETQGGTGESYDDFFEGLFDQDDDEKN
jgi:hypothetical protein